MISQETKDSIDKEAFDYVTSQPSDYGDLSVHAEVQMRDSYIAAATEYAEKLEEKDKKIEELKQQAIFSEEIEKQLQVRIGQDLKKLESKDREIELLKEDINNQTSFLQRLLQIKDRELAQLKEEIIRLDKEIDMYRDALELDQLNRVDRVGFPKPFGL